MVNTPLGIQTIKWLNVKGRCLLVPCVWGRVVFAVVVPGSGRFQLSNLGYGLGFWLVFR